MPFRRCGRFRGAMRPEHYETMARNMEDLRKAVGLESHMVPRVEQQSEIGSDAFYGGTVIANDASLHPALYHAGLMQRVDAGGGIVAGRAEVTLIEREGSHFRLSTPRGEIKARDVIVATDGYTGSLLPDLKRRIVPITSSIIATGDMPQSLLERLLPKNCVYGNTLRVFSYFQSAPGEQRIVWGGRGARFGSGSTPRNYAHLARDMLRIFPDLKDAPITHAWSGLIDKPTTASRTSVAPRPASTMRLGIAGTPGCRAARTSDTRSRSRCWAIRTRAPHLTSWCFRTFPCNPLPRPLSRWSKPG